MTKHTLPLRSMVHYLMYANAYPTQLATRTTARSPSLDEALETDAMAITPGGSHRVSTGTLAREREKFFDLLRTKYPEHDKGVEEFLSAGDTASDKVSCTDNIHACTMYMYIHVHVYTNT